MLYTSVVVDCVSFYELSVRSLFMCVYIGLMSSLMYAVIVMSTCYQLLVGRQQVRRDGVTAIESPECSCETSRAAINLSNFTYRTKSRHVSSFVP